ncbi:MAG: hypothetical protein WCO44_09735 [Bacteroidota bacterium]
MQPSQEIVKSSSLRFGVMCSGAVFQRWQADALLELMAKGHRPVLLITDPRRPPRGSRIKSLLKRDWRVFLFTFLENRLFKPAARKPADLSSEMPGIQRLECRVRLQGFSEYFEEQDIDIIRNYKLDFILRFGFNIIRGDILTAARCGVWSFHHGDEVKYRGGPAGFWEIFNGDPVNGAILQQLTGKLDGGIILKKGYLKTIGHSYKGNLEQLLSVSSSWPAMVADMIAAKTATPFLKSETSAPVYKLPGNGNMVLFLLKLFRNKVAFHYAGLFRSEDWNIGIVDHPLPDIALGNVILKSGDIRWFRGIPKGTYLADPSGFTNRDNLHILAENFSYAGGKAIISEFVISGGNEIAAPPNAGESNLFQPGLPIHSSPTCAIDNGFHLSYPFVVEHDGEVYCVPESYQSGIIALYRRDRATGSFPVDSVLLGNVQAVDPTLFFHEGLWWLSFTMKEHSNSHLCLYYATDIKGPYQPHACNPVKIDVRSARPAGTPFMHKGMLYRPAQDCSETYGGRTVINKIVVLTAGQFLEEQVNVVEPVPDTAWNKGLHTLSAVGTFTVLDGKRYRFNRHFFISQLRSKLITRRPQDV